MKKQIAVFLSALYILSAFSGCGNAESETKKDTGVHKETTAVTKMEDSSQTDKDKKVCAVGKVGTNGNSTVTKVQLTPKENKDISESTRFTDLYGKNVLHTGVVGLVGAPVGISYDTSLKNPTLTFTYNPDKLNGVRPDALMFLWYNESQNNYQELSGETLDTKKCTVSIDIDKQGDYMLVNKYQWAKCWGADIDDFGLEPDYTGNHDISSEKWEANAYTGDIVKLADMDYIKSCIGKYTTTFNVKNSKQLASAVYYANCAPKDYNGNKPSIIINIMNDIDLSGIAWAPIGWDSGGIDYAFTGNIAGNGHTISNMTIDGKGDSGFVGNGYVCSISNLNFKNCTVSGNNVGIIMGLDVGSRISDCKCQGKTSGSIAGSMVGNSRDTVFIGKCSANVVANGKRETRYLTGSDKQLAEISKKVPKTVKITVDNNYVIKRPSNLSKYKGLVWFVESGNQRILERNAENETEFHFQEIYKEGGIFSVSLGAYIDGYYVPISNTVEFEIKKK